MGLYQSKKATLSDFRLPRLSDYFKSLNTENMSFTLVDRMSREELWVKARNMLVEDRRKLQDKLIAAECTFEPQVKPQRNKKQTVNSGLGAPSLESVRVSNQEKRAIWKAEREKVKEMKKLTEEKTTTNPIKQPNIKERNYESIHLKYRAFQYANVSQN